MRDDWQRAEQYCSERLLADPAFNVAGYYYESRLGWLELIKSLRGFRSCGIYEAQKEALADPRWITWVLRRIRTDRRCAKQALWHVQQCGDAALIPASAIPSPLPAPSR